MAGRHRLKWGAPAFTLTLFVLALVVACQGVAAPTPDELPSSSPSLEVLQVVTSRGIGGDYVPVDITSQFSPADTFYCAVQVAGAERDTEVVARWYFGDALISEATYTTEASGSGYLAFELANQQPWPKGFYRVEIASAGVMLGTVDFQVAK